jgi:FKBP-type peptidyl-prolyl cis-trans isomerase
MRPLSLLGLLLLPLAGCDSGSPESGSASDDPFTCADGTLQTTDVVVGTGETATETSTVVLDYVGRLTDGTEFDRAADGEYALAGAIEGIRRGVAGMRVGGQRTITVPPNMGYGTRTPNSIPECSTLVYEITLRDVR